MKYYGEDIFINLSINRLRGMSFDGSVKIIDYSNNNLEYYDKGQDIPQIFFVGNRMIDLNDYFNLDNALNKA
jgi:hypothetical protein